MPHWFYNASYLTALLIIYLFCCSVSFVGYKISRVFFQKVDKYEIVTKIVWQTVLFFSTMLITFWIAINWHNLRNLTQVTNIEAQKIERVYSYSELPKDPKYTKKLRTALMKYLDSVINKEYKSLEIGFLNNETLLDFQNFVKIANDYLPNNSRTNEFAYNRLLIAIEELAQARTDRLSYLPGELNGVLLGFFIVIMIVGCFWTGAIYSGNLLFSLIIIMSQNIIMGSSIWLILEIDKPFQGEIKVTNQAFVEAKDEIQRINSRKKIHE